MPVHTFLWIICISSKPFKVEVIFWATPSLWLLCINYFYSGCLYFFLPEWWLVYSHFLCVCVCVRASLRPLPYTTEILLLAWNIFYWKQKWWYLSDLLKIAWFPMYHTLWQIKCMCWNVIFLMIRYVFTNSN